MCLWELKLFDLLLMLMQKSNFVRMILCHRSCSAQHRFFNSSPNVLTAAAISDPNIDVKSNVLTQVDFGFFFLLNLGPKVSPNRAQIGLKIEYGGRPDVGASLGGCGGKRRTKSNTQRRVWGGG